MKRKSREHEYSVQLRRTLWLAIIQRSFSSGRRLPSPSHAGSKNRLVEHRDTRSANGTRVQGHRRGGSAEQQQGRRSHGKTKAASQSINQSFSAAMIRSAAFPGFNLNTAGRKERSQTTMRISRADARKNENENETSRDKRQYTYFHPARSARSQSECYTTLLPLPLARSRSRCRTNAHHSHATLRSRCAVLCSAAKREDTSVRKICNFSYLHPPPLTPATLPKVHSRKMHTPASPQQPPSPHKPRAGYSLSSIFAFSISSATSLSARLSCASCAPASALPLTPWFACAGLRALSAAPSCAAAAASASSLSISACALAMF